MADTIRYINPAGTVGTQDGTTSASGSSGTAAYATWAQWEAAENTDLTVTGGHHIVYVVAGANNEPRIAISGWTTDDTHRLKIMANPGDECKGVLDAGARLDGDHGSANQRILNYVQHIEFHGISISNFYNQPGIQRAANGTITHVEGCYIASGGYIMPSAYTETLVAKNSVLGGTMVCYTGQTQNFYHCTLLGRLAGQTLSTCNMFNCINAAADAFLGFGDGTYPPDGTLSGKNNFFVSADNSEFNGTASGNDWGNTFTFTGGTDYSLAAGDTSGAKTGGANISGETYGPVATDITGAARTQSAPSAGAFEFGASTGPTITDVNGTESWNDGATGLVITGTDFV